jgi:hypothetical protein
MQFSVAPCYLLHIGPITAYVNLVRETEGMKFVEVGAITVSVNIKVDCKGIGWKNVNCFHQGQKEN